MKFILIFVLTAFAGESNQQKCYSTADVKNSVCWALCRNDGSDTGIYDTKHDECLCADRKKFKEATRQAIKLPSSMRITTTPTVVEEKKASTSYYPSWYGDDE